MSPVSFSVSNGGQILMQQLRIHGVRRLFMVRGESFLPCIDALNEHIDVIQPIVCRQESGAAYMAEAYGGYGEVVDRTENFAGAFQRALDFAAEHSLPALIEIRYDADGIAPGETLSKIRHEAQQLLQEN